jgi:hypothetical protein
MPNLDHRELAFHTAAFAKIYKFITGRASHTLSVSAEPEPPLSGVVTGIAETIPTNLSLAGVHLRIYPVGRTKLIEAASHFYEITTKMMANRGHS